MGFSEDPVLISSTPLVNRFSVRGGNVFAANSAAERELDVGVAVFEQRCAEAGGDLDEQLGGIGRELVCQRAGSH